MVILYAFDWVIRLIPPLFGGVLDASEVLSGTSQFWMLKQFGLMTCIFLVCVVAIIFFCRWRPFGLVLVKLLVMTTIAGMFMVVVLCTIVGSLAVGIITTARLILLGIVVSFGYVLHLVIVLLRLLVFVIVLLLFMLWLLMVWLLARGSDLVVFEVDSLL